MTYTLGVDLGTTYCAVAVHRNGQTEIVPLAHRSMVTPSAVFVTADDEVLVGEPALRRGVDSPGRLAHEFKRRLGDPIPILVGGRPYTAEALTALLLAQLVGLVAEREGGPAARTVLTFPANWGPHKQGLLAEAIRLASVSPAGTLTEPEAAAIWYASAERVQVGETVAVYDLGGGTFDAAVLRKAEDGFAVLGTPQGIERLGGIDVDEAVFRHVCSLLEIDARSLTSSAPGRRAAARLRAECVDAKEALSADTAVTIPVALPELHVDVRLTRSELEAMVRPVLEDTIVALRAAIHSAGLETDDVDRVLLVGGASRMPIVGDMVTRALRRPFFVDAHPKHVVALGAALAAASLQAGAAVRPLLPPAAPPRPTPPAPVPSARGMEQPAPTAAPASQPDVAAPSAPAPPRPAQGPSRPDSGTAHRSTPEAAAPPAPALPRPTGGPPPAGSTAAPSAPPDRTAGTSASPPSAPADRVGAAGTTAAPPSAPSARDGAGGGFGLRRPPGWVLGVAAAVLVLVAAVVATRGGGGDGGGGGASAGRTTTTGPAVEGVPGGEAVDLAMFNHGMPDHIDPALAPTQPSTQVVDALYDGLTTVDVSIPGDPRVVPQVAETYTPNDDATSWTFAIRDGLRFSDGTSVLPSSFVRGWERATDPGFADPAAAVFDVIQGAAEKRNGEADTISGLRADDAELTLQVDLAEPLASFDSLVAFQLFMPMPEAVDSLADQGEWEDGVMVGNGPFVLDGPRSDEELALVRNEEWDGTLYDPSLRLPDQPFLERLTFRASPDPQTAYQAFQAGAGQVAFVPADQFAAADETYPNTFDNPLVISYHLQLAWTHPQLGGPENRELRQAISLAIDRDAINQLLYGGTAQPASGITPPAVPGFGEDLCQYCTYDPDAARAALGAWQSAGNQLDEPIPIQSSAAPGTSDVAIAKVVENLAAVGIPAVETAIPPEEYWDRLTAGDCVVCPVGALPYYLSYDDFLQTFFHSAGLEDRNYGRFTLDSFDQLVDEARATPDITRRADLLQRAERQLLDDETAVIPLLWSTPGYAYADELAALPQTGTGLVVWERVYLDSAG